MGEGCFEVGFNVNFENIALLFLGTLLGLSLCLCQLLPEIVDYSNDPVPGTVEICRCR